MAKKQTTQEPLLEETATWRKITITKSEMEEALTGEINGLVIGGRNVEVEFDLEN